MTGPGRDGQDRNGAPAAESLLDRPVVGAVEVAAVEDAVRDLLATDNDVVLVQAEAVVALEACARSLARPGLRALNVVTGPYGALFGRWLGAAGAAVVDLEVPFDRVVSAQQVRDALSGSAFDVVAVVHAEAATGGANPVAAIAEVVREHGALLVVDAVASVGAQPVAPDEWRADVVVIGAQKALAGPAGVSVLSVSGRAWELMERNPGAPRESVLSLLDLRDGWLRPGRGTLLGTPSSLETAALGEALRRVAATGLPTVVAGHLAAAAATRAGVRELGLRPWIVADGDAAAVVTTVSAVPGRTVMEVVVAARAAGSRILGPAPGLLAATTLRVNHTGLSANLAAVTRELQALGQVLHRSSKATVAAAEEAWSAVMVGGRTH